MATQTRAALLLALLAAAPLAAAPDTGDAITVTADRLRDKELRQKTDTYVRKVLPTTISGQHARWHEPICPVAIGLSERAAGPFIRKIIATAETLKLRVASEPCEPNIALIFTADARAAMRDIERRKPQLLNEVSSADRKRLLDGAAPVRWWHMTETEGYDGRRLVNGAAPALGIGTITGDFGPPILNTTRASNIESNIRVGLRGVTIVIDVPRAEGYAIDAMADYVALIAFGRARMDATDHPADSILALFDAPDAASRPAGWSAVDRAYLSALYTVSASQAGDYQRYKIISQIVDDLKKPAETSAQ